MAALCSAVLGLQHIGVHDSSFSFSHHSLLTTQFTRACSAAPEAALPLRILFARLVIAVVCGTLARARIAVAAPRGAASDRQRGETPEGQDVLPVGERAFNKHKYLCF
ncbi:hypothetical protein [Azohydromonas australica]|uniref:hypothetical protein n=1 Tax=Azohydromonas australica TaxID=364039 RepID=UPI00048F1EE0|nr:hypothetical protein [Azohydromonas australica]